MMIKKYGKEYGEIELIKKNFLDDNERLLKEAERIGDIYRKQPPRCKCKLCNNSLNIGKEISFTSHKITYKICSFCSHVNGVYDDTLEFSNAIYNDSDYSVRYSENSKQSYDLRVELIYRPKVLFLKEVLGNIGSILEIGAGSGYFCEAAKNENYDILGIEVSEMQVEFANKMSGGGIVQHVPLESVLDNIRNTNREIIVAIGVLEHIYNMRDTLMAIKDNKNIKYLYFSVPLFSLSVFFEMVFSEGYNRQLGGPHTHLFSMESINNMNKEFNFEIVGQWIFGVDMVDLYRFMQLRFRDENKEALEIFKKKFSKSIDSLQKVIDESEFASEVHMIVKVLH